MVEWLTAPSSTSSKFIPLALLSHIALLIPTRRPNAGRQKSFTLSRYLSARFKFGEKTLLKNLGNLELKSALNNKNRMP